METNLIPQIQQSPWIKHWAGQWSILSCSYFGHQYTQTIQNVLGTRVKRCIILSANGTSTAFFETNDLNAFGNELCRKVEANINIVPEWCNELKRCTDNILSTIQSLQGKVPVEENVTPFINALYAYSQAHIAVKKIVDFLPPALLEKTLPLFEKARIYAEPVYTETEKFTRQFVTALSQKTNYPSHLLLCMVKEELSIYFKTAQLPEKEILDERFNATALIFNEGKYEVYVGKNAKEIENAILNKPFSGELKGFCAYPGKIRGKVKIILNPKDQNDFAEGDILITGMTRPDYFSFFKKASAVVTDAGGVLSHAAITARELHKPTIIGTLSATKSFRNGDFVEVDAKKGIIQKIN